MCAGAQGRGTSYCAVDQQDIYKTNNIQRLHNTRTLSGLTHKEQETLSTT